MTVLLAELKAYKSEVVNDTSANGGRRGSVEIVSGAVQNVFEHVFRSQRLAGITGRYRKVFYANLNDADETAYNAMPFFHKPPGGDHYLWWFAGTFDDTQDDITGSERKYGSASLKTAVTAGGSTLVVTLKNAAQSSMFADGDPIMVSDKATPDSSTGNEELQEISGAPSLSGLDLTITISGTLTNGYAAGAAVSSGVNMGDVACAVDNWAETCAGSGTYDEASYPVVTDNIGTVYDTYTLTFTDATNFTVVGAKEGNVGSGTTSADFAPVNSARSNKPFFTLEAGGWAGTWASGDSIVFRTKPAEFSVWETLVVPPDSSPLGAAGFYGYLDLETA